MGLDANAAIHFASGFVTITPTQPAPLAGYGDRREPFAGVADDLEANVVILRHGDRPVVLVAFDLLYVGNLLRQKLVAALHSRVAADDLFLAASHTHFAPATDPTLPHLGAVVHDYVALVVDRVATLVNRLLDGEFKPLDLAVGQANADNAINRRRVGWGLSRRYPFLRKGVWMGPNRRGRTDETLRTLRFGSDAIVWSYSCHPVFVPWMTQVSADFVGVIRRIMREKMGPRTAVLFWQGFSADVYPSFATTMVGPTTRLRRFFSRSAAAVTPATWNTWAERLASHVVKANLGAVNTPVAGRMLSARVNFPLHELLRESATDKCVSAHQLRIGRDVAVFGISAEPAAEYAAHFQNAFPNSNLFCVGCMDGVFGYLPSAQMIREGGYEAADFLPHFSLQGKFVDAPEKIVCDRLRPGLFENADS